MRALFYSHCWCPYCIIHILRRFISKVEEKKASWCGKEKERGREGEQKTEKKPLDTIRRAHSYSGLNRNRNRVEIWAKSALTRNIYFLIHIGPTNIKMWIWLFALTHTHTSNTSSHNVLSGYGANASSSFALIHKRNTRSIRLHFIIHILILVSLEIVTERKSEHNAKHWL